MTQLSAVAGGTTVGVAPLDGEFREFGVVVVVDDAQSDSVLDEVVG